MLERLAALLMHPSYGQLGLRDLRVLHALLVHADQQGVAWPSRPRIAQLAQLDESHVRRSLRHLQDCGIVSVLSTGKGRTATKVCVLGGATTEVLRACLTRKRGGAESAPSQNPNHAVREGAISASSEGAESAPLTMQGTHQGTPPKAPQGGAGNRSAPPETLKPETSASVPHRIRSVRQADSTNDGDARSRQRRLMFLAVQRLGSIESEFKVRAALHDFDAAGGTMHELSQLIAETIDGKRSARDRVGLVVKWAGHVGLWRSVLADRYERQKSATQPFRNASSATLPAAVSELLQLPARASQ